MSLTYKFALKRIKQANQYSFHLVLRVSERYKTKELRLGYKLSPNQWDSKNQIAIGADDKVKRANLKIDRYKKIIQRALILNEFDDRTYTSDDLLSDIKKHECENETPKEIDFIAFSESIIQELLESGKAGNALVYKCAVSKLKSYLHSKPITVSRLDFKFIKKFESSMLAENIKVNSISVYLRTIRAICNRAIVEGLINKENYPFHNFKINSEPTVSRRLSIDEMKRLANCKGLSKTQEYWLDVFLLSFCLIGINLTDLLCLSNSSIDEDRVVFRRAKTGKIYSIKLHTQTKQLISKLRADVHNDSDLLFSNLAIKTDPLERKKRIAQLNKTCNKHIKEIAKKSGVNKSITTYYARYSWANIARDLDYPKDMIAEALGHEYGNKVTGIYLDSYDASKIDKMNEQVLSCVFKV